MELKKLIHYFDTPPFYWGAFLGLLIISLILYASYGAEEAPPLL
jgi:hypothetical protein